MSGWELRGRPESAVADWPAMAEYLADWRAAWADLDGLHIDAPAPRTLPTTSHLWAWTTSAWVRVRIDGDRWIGGGLFRGTHPEAEVWTAPRENVDVVTDVICSWAKDDGRVLQLRLAEGDIPPRMQQLVPIGPNPAVYIGSVESYREPV